MKGSSNALSNRVWSAGRLFAIAACLVATYLLFAVTAMRVALQVREVPVPDLRNHTVAEATAQTAGSRPRTGRRRKRPPRSEDSGGPHRAAGACARRDHPPSTQRSRVGEPGPEDHGHPCADRRVGARGAVAAAAGRAGRHLARRSAIVRFPERHHHRAGAAGSASGTEVALLVNRGERSHYYVMPDLIGVAGSRAVDLAAHARIPRHDRRRAALSGRAGGHRASPVSVGRISRSPPAIRFRWRSAVER